YDKWRVKRDCGFRRTKPRLSPVDSRLLQSLRGGVSLLPREVYPARSVGGLVPRLSPIPRTRAIRRLVGRRSAYGFLLWPDAGVDSKGSQASSIGHARLLLSDWLQIHDL